MLLPGSFNQDRPVPFPLPCSGPECHAQKRSPALPTPPVVLSWGLSWEAILPVLLTFAVPGSRSYVRELSLGTPRREPFVPFHPPRWV